MPKVQWSKLPPALRDHLLDRLRDRQITAEDLYQLKLWRESEPDAPDGDWFNIFGKKSPSAREGMNCCSYYVSSMIQYGYAI